MSHKTTSYKDMLLTRINSFCSFFLNKTFLNLSLQKEYDNTASFYKLCGTKSIQKKIGAFSEIDVTSLNESRDWCVVCRRETHFS